MQLLQRSFVETIVQQARASDIETKLASKLVVQNYLQKSLSFHVRLSVTVPLREDPAVLKWLLDSDLVVVDQVLAGLKISDVHDLAAWLEDTQNDYWAAIKLCSALGIHGRTTAVVKGTYLQRALKIMQRIDLQQPEAADFECKIRYRIYYMVSSFRSLSVQNRIYDMFTSTARRKKRTLV